MPYLVSWHLERRIPVSSIGQLSILATMIPKVFKIELKNMESLSY